MTAERCAVPGPNCPRERRWSAKRGGWLWMCAQCKRAFPEDADGTPSATPLRGDPDPSIQCPLCESPMAPVRGTRNGDFWSCAQYPKCKGTRPLQSKEVTK